MTRDQVNLILVEGIPGAGKSTIARYVHGLLVERGRQAHLHLEGDIDHPADFEAFACLSMGEYRRLCVDFPDWATAIQADAFHSDTGHMLISYGRLQRLYHGKLPNRLLSDLRRHDAVDGTDLAVYRQIAVERWRNFGSTAVRGLFSYVFECCFLQNPTTVLMCRHNAAPATIEAHIRAMADAVRLIAPQLIYLRHLDVRGTLERVAAQRPAAWLEFVIDYVTRQGWGREHGLSGFDGMVAFYQARQELELDMMRRLTIPHLVLDPTAVGWEATRAAIRATVKAQAIALPGPSDSDSEDD